MHKNGKDLLKGLTTAVIGLSLTTLSAEPTANASVVSEDELTEDGKNTLVLKQNLDDHSIYNSHGSHRSHRSHASHASHRSHRSQWHS